MRRQTIQLPTDLYGTPRGELVVFIDEDPPAPRFSLGNFIRINDNLYEIVYMFRLLTDPRTWRYVLEERSSVFISADDDLWIHLHHSGCIGCHIPRCPRFLFESKTLAGTFFEDVPLIGQTRELDDPALTESGVIISSGEVVDDSVLDLRARLTRMAFGHPDIMAQVMSRQISLTDAFEQFLAFDMAMGDMPLGEE